MYTNCIFMHIKGLDFLGRSRDEENMAKGSLRAMSPVSRRNFKTASCWTKIELFRDGLFETLHGENGSMLERNFQTHFGKE